METSKQKVTLASLLAQYDKEQLTATDFNRAFAEVVTYVKNIKEVNAEEFKLLYKIVDELSTKVTHDASTEIDQLKRFVTSTVERQIEIINAKLASIVDGVDGAPGKDADAQAIVQLVLTQLPPSIPLDPYDDKEILIQLENLEKELERLKQAPSAKGTTPGWGAHPLAIQQSGTTKVKVARVINFTGATVTQTPQGVTTVAVTGGSGGFQQPSSGTVNGVNKIFVFATAPNAVSVDQGRLMQATSSDGTVNWTGTTTITLAVAPTSDIFAAA